MAEVTVRLAAVSGRTREERVRPMLPGGRSTGSKGCELGWSRDLRARIRQYLSFRTDPRSKFFPADHDADGTRMPGGRDPELRHCRFQWLSHSIAVKILVFLACIGCRREPQMRPDGVYAQIEKKLIAGELSNAREESKQAYEYFKSIRPDWAATFRVELGKVLIYQGESGDALALLQQPFPAQSSIESQVRRNIFLAIAQARCRYYTPADKTPSKCCPARP